ncbi:hypothetical protein PanWU01x14_295860 [Parasponia andersonii]|uniref:Uncharacterized protein n=1 Tax=Parasponia andersonii TaxID=3476 RepID=A0A2P5AW16_PARAD|nr:hypothetical protein PanWU01x14_295860 [Parasponia andersonii]
MISSGAHQPHEGGQQLGWGRPLRGVGLHSGDELQEEDSKTVDVVLLGGYSGFEVVRVGVTRGAHQHHRSSIVGYCGREAHLGRAEIAELEIEILVQKKIGGFDVPVNDWQGGAAAFVV